MSHAPETSLTSQELAEQILEFRTYTKGIGIVDYPDKAAALIEAWVREREAQILEEAALEENVVTKSRAPQQVQILSQEEPEEYFRINFKGFLAVRLMGFDYQGKHYSYHGRKLDNAVRRLTADSNKPVGAPPVHELAVWGQARHDWEKMTKGEPT